MKLVNLVIAVCMNTNISAFIKARVFKFGTKVSVYHMQLKLIVNINCHAHRLLKTFFAIIKLSI